MEVTDKNNGARSPQDASFRPTSAAARAPFRKRKCTRGQRWFSRWWPSMCWCPAADGCSEGSWQARPRPAGPGLQLAGSGKVSPGSWWPPSVEEEKQRLLPSAPVLPSLPFLQAVPKRRRCLGSESACSSFQTLMLLLWPPTHRDCPLAWGRGRGMEIGEKSLLS